jgi:hypothetical protein
MGGASAPDDFDEGYLTQTWLAVSEDPAATVSGRYWHHYLTSTPSRIANIHRSEFGPWAADASRPCPTFVDECRISPQVLGGAKAQADRARGSRRDAETRGILRPLAVAQFVIERDIPGAGRLTEDQIRDISVQSLAVLKSMGPEIQWVHSYVTDDRIYCVYFATDEAPIREHARQLGVPASRVSAVRHLVNPDKYR